MMHVLLMMMILRVQQRYISRPTLLSVWFSASVSVVLQMTLACVSGR